jgi:hypothetical protein
VNNILFFSPFFISLVSSYIVSNSSSLRFVDMHFHLFLKTYYNNTNLNYIYMGHLKPWILDKLREYKNNYVLPCLVTYLQHSF